MAFVTLLAMTTFVFCTGVGGDLSDLLLRLFGGRGGTTLARLDGSSITDVELGEMRTRRNLANRFMIRAADVCRYALFDRAERFKEARLVALEKNEPREELTKMANQERGLRMLANHLFLQSKKARYFDGAANFEDLIDFSIWLKQADRLGIYLTDEDVTRLVNREMYWTLSEFSGKEELPSRAWRDVFDDARRGLGAERATQATLIQALREEYRVQLAQLSLLKAHAQTLMSPERPFDPVQEIRMPLSPQQLFDYYKSNRSTFDVTLVPIQVGDFTKKVKDPDIDELTAYFKKYQRERYDPTSSTPGFEIPHAVQVEWVSADPKSPFYQKLTQAATALETHPWWSWSPTLGPASWVPLVTGPAFLDQALEGVVERSLAVKSRTGAGLMDSDLLTPLVSYRALHRPGSIASWVGSWAAPAGAVTPAATLAAFYEDARLRYGPQMQEALHDEVRQRMTNNVRLFGLCTASPYTGLFFARDMARATPPLMPLSAFRDEVKDRYQSDLARAWANKNVGILRDALDKQFQKVRPTEAALERELSDHLTKLGLDRVRTAGFHDRYDIGQAKELAPLREAYQKTFHYINAIEGRSGAKALKEDEFHRLFFDSGESFTANTRYEPKAWPPDLKIKASPIQANVIEQGLFRDLQNPAGFDANATRRAAETLKKQLETLQGFNPKAQETTFHMFSLAEKPFLFWKVADKPGQLPEKLEEVKPRVLGAWLTHQAREQFAWPKAQEVAESILKADNYGLAAHKEAKALGQEPIYLREISRLVPEIMAEGLGAMDAKTEYVPYALPPDLIPYPREDTAANLLKLHDLQEPFKSGEKEPDDLAKKLDDLNQKLFEQTNKIPVVKERPGKYVQVLANKPRTMYYVAVVTTTPFENREDFRRVYAASGYFQGPDGLMGPADTLVLRAQEQAGRDFRRQLLDQYRRQMNYQTTEEGKRARESFDTQDEGN